ncbi:MAG: hypothetical protein QW461_10720 [Candidatus Jordarchaeales archaeon]
MLRRLSGSEACGRLVISDVALLRGLQRVKHLSDAYAKCIVGAPKTGKFGNHKKGAGFRDVRVVVETSFPVENAVGDLI